MHHCELETAYDLLAQQQVELEMQNESLREAILECDILRTDLMKSMRTTLLLNTTGMERRVLKKVCTGLTSKEIGDMLCLSPRTIETHRANLLKKLEAKNLTELLRWEIVLDTINMGM